MRYLKTLFMALAISLSAVSYGHAAMKVVQKPVSYGYKAAAGRTIDTVIVHATYNPALKTQTLAGAMTLWKHDDVSPHYAIDKAGTVYQLVAEKNIAWHAGVSSLPNGATDVNTRSIGIELIYSNKETPTAAQYKSLQSLLKDIEGRYSIKYVLGHEQVAPSRKVDPWNFDYTKISDVFTPATTVFPAPITLSSTIFQSAISPLTDAQQAVMKNYSYRASCPVALSDLRVVNVSYVDFDGDTQQGTLVVNSSVADNTVAAFKALFDQKFPIRKIVPIDTYEGVDAISMAADNTSAFNCRPVSGTTTFSEHSYGTAIDINPKENPFTVTALNTKAKGSVSASVVSIMKNYGFLWGGTWTAKKDYQHFSVSGK
jgi:poly-gamma-glutamate synthesis protein (capsule biosynthesis protein)